MSKATPIIGIYKITLAIDGRCYVGQSADMVKRWYQHSWHLRRGRHHAGHLQNAWNKYGEDAFTFEILEEVSPPTLLLEDLKELLTAREQFWMDELSPTFNGSPSAASNLGTTRDQASRARTSLSLREAFLSDANRLSVQRPDIACEWHPIKNEPLTPYNTTVGNDLRAWWLCPDCGFEWQATVSSRCGTGTGCPECAKWITGAKNARPKNGNSLAEKRPDLVPEWNPVRNGVAPDQVAWASSKKAWWICSKCGHSWQAVIGSRAKGNRGCPSCKGTPNDNGNGYKSKLTPTDALEILRLAELGKALSEQAAQFSYKKIAEQFDLTEGTVSHIVSGRQWGHVTGRSNPDALKKRLKASSPRT